VLDNRIWWRAAVPATMAAFETTPKPRNLRPKVGDWCLWFRDMPQADRGGGC
jgi:hypothetical protein